MPCLNTHTLYRHSHIRSHTPSAVYWQRTCYFWRCCVVIVIMVALSRVFYSTCKVLGVIWSVLSALRNQVVCCDCGLVKRAGVLQPSAWNLCTAASRPLEVVSDHPRAWGRGGGALAAPIGSSPATNPRAGPPLGPRRSPGPITRRPSAPVGGARRRRAGHGDKMCGERGGVGRR